MVQLFLNNSNLCDHSSPTSQTDRQTTCDRNTALCTKVHRAVKMVNGFRCYRALDSVSIASALSTALTIYPCHIRVHQRWQSKLQLQLERRSGGRPQRAVHPMRLPVNNVIHTTLVGLEPATFRSLVDCWSDALPVPPTHPMIGYAQGQKMWMISVNRSCTRVYRACIDFGIDMPVGTGQCSAIQRRDPMSSEITPEWWRH